MREHAIPQDVTGYRFHIIGNMTLKQFLEVGAGCLVGVGIYSTNLPAIIKWPMIVMVVAMGAMAAFVPIEERPFDHWIVTFFKTLYKPTKFYWRRESKLPDPFLYRPAETTTTVNIEIDLKPARRQRIKEYISSVQNMSGSVLYDTNEVEKINELMNLFDQTELSVPIEITNLTEKPDLKVRVRSFRPPPTSATIDDVVLPALPQATSSDTQLQEDENIPTTKRLNVTALPSSQVGQQINIPAPENISIESQVISHQSTPEVTTSVEDRVYLDTQATFPNYIPSQEIVQNVSLPFPAPPTEPNRLVGMVLTPNNELLNDAIVEITTQDGQVARAVKSNALGQFFITTPLANGTYTIMAERDGYSFEPLSLSLTGQLVAPLEIRCHEVTTTPTSIYQNIPIATAPAPAV